MTNLPITQNVHDDVIREVFAALDSRSIVNFRQTCRRIYEISKTYSVWAHSREFKNWTSDEPDVSRVRKLELPNWNFVLVPGGRWLLAILNCPHLLLAAFDLDTDAMDEHVVIEDILPSPSDLIAAAEAEMVIGVDKVSSGTSFTLAICRRDYTAPRHCMSLWNIRLSADSRTLQAATPSTLILDRQSYTPPGENPHAEAGLLIQSGSSKLSSTLEIIDWKKSTPTVHFKAAIVQEDDAQTYCVYFVAETKMVLVLRHGSIAMYAVPQFKGLPIQALPRSTIGRHAPRWICKFQCLAPFPVLSSPLYSSFGRLSFAVWTDHLFLYSTTNPDTSPICSWEGSPYTTWFHSETLGPTRGVMVIVNPGPGRSEIRCLTYLPATSANKHLVEGMRKNRFEVRGEWIVAEGGCTLDGCNDDPHVFHYDEASGRLISRHGIAGNLIQIRDFL
ncbi:hypothetical protein FRB93_002377 [Tulasnella sp. JGI-2019a]|nr:hypothetical protein FRB93_002377 [Tulasnella sp. JGI-2019a]